MTAYAEQLPPHDIQAEESVVASILVAAAECLPLVTDVVQPADFFREQNRWTYEACLTLAARGEGINQITVAHEMERAGRLEEAGGHAYLTELILNLPTHIGVEHYAGIVKRDAQHRALISTLHQGMQDAYAGGPDFDAVLTKHLDRLQALQSDGPMKGWTSLGDALDVFLDPPTAESFEPYQGRVRTGLGDLDALLTGVADTNLVIVAARTGIGKTALMLNMARNAAVGQQLKVGMFSLEMAVSELAQRLLSSEAQVDSKRLRFGTHSEAEEGRLMHAHGVLSGAQLYIDDSKSLRVSEMRSRLQRLQCDVGLDLVIVDYLQLVDGDGRNRVDEVGQVTRGLKKLAGEFDVPVIAGAQLSRATEQRAGHVPMLSDLRESGSIEQDADVVLFIHREDAYMNRQEWESTHPDRNRDPYPEGVAKLIVAKHRNGPTGEADVRFHRYWSKFEDLEPRVEQQGVMV